MLICDYSSQYVHRNNYDLTRSFLKLWIELQNRVRPRFFDQVGHETMYASSGNRHFFTKSRHRRQTYQNYEQPPRTSQSSYFQMEERFCTDVLCFCCFYTYTEIFLFYARMYNVYKKFLNYFESLNSRCL